MDRYCKALAGLALLHRDRAICICAPIHAEQALALFRIESHCGNPPQMAGQVIAGIGNVSGLPWHPTFAASEARYISAWVHICKFARNSPTYQCAQHIDQVVGFAWSIGKTIAQLQDVLWSQSLYESITPNLFNDCYMQVI